MNLLVAILDSDGTLRAVNQAFARRVDAQAPPPLRTSVFAVLHPADHGPLRHAMVVSANGAGRAGPVRARLASEQAWIETAVTVSRLGGEPALEGALLLSAELLPVGTQRAMERAAPSAGSDDADSMADALLTALDEGQFHLAYQPKVALATNRIVGVEALLRWDHPALGPVAPCEFIAVAEATGLIVPIGVWVIEAAFRQCAAWQEEFPRTTPMSVAVNASARQFRAGLVDVVRGAVEGSGIDPAGVCLEVTESTVMDDVDAAVSILGELKDLGLTLSIDDFGTGYSSLAYLRRLPLDEVKIDRSFVDGLATDPEDTAIVAAVISLAHALDRDVVAEGVETEEQLQKLRSLGCELAQGFLLARPMPARGVTSLLAADLAGERLGGRVSGRAGSGTESVLVADDAADVRQLARMSLTAAGFEVEEAVDGAAAVAMARWLNPSAVVLDVSMPDMSGIEVCRLLRADPDTAGCTVVMLTTHDEASDKAAAFSAGADEYIVKPFAPRDLVSRVRTALARRAAAG
jgi:EAL domain-containing protein (putative c-di-GMP-specific phosphodiesterase class I)/ActR/RegA family two-component response regulator